MSLKGRVVLSVIVSILIVGMSPLDALADSVTDTITVGVSPVALAYDSANGRMYVANQVDGTVSVISTSSNTVTDTITVGNFPIGIAYDSANGRMYVTNEFDDTVSVITITQTLIGGELLPIETTALLLAGAYTTASWMIPVVLSAVGIGLAVFTLRKK